jgi:hypothetical protein
MVTGSCLDINLKRRLRPPGSLRQPVRAITHDPMKQRDKNTRRQKVPVVERIRKNIFDEHVSLGIDLKFSSYRNRRA